MNTYMTTGIGLNPYDVRPVFGNSTLTKQTGMNVSEAHGLSRPAALGPQLSDGQAS